MKPGIITKILFCSLCPLLSLANAGESWDASSHDTSQWSLVKYSNKNSGVIGNFTNSTEGMDFGQEDSAVAEGLIGNELGFLKYTLASGSLADYDKGTIGIEYQDTFGSSFLPSVVLFDGQDKLGNRMVLACELATSTIAGKTVGNIMLEAANFKAVTRFYYSIDDMDNPNSTYDLTFNTAPTSLSDEDFSLFLGTTQSILIRTFNNQSDWYNPMIGGAGSYPGTFLYSLNVTEANIPEPVTPLLVMPGLLGLALSRKKAA